MCQTFNLESRVRFSDGLLLGYLMRTIKVVLLGRVVEIGTNDRDGGLFSWVESGSWSQFAGNGQTPRFRSPAQRYLTNE